VKYTCIKIISAPHSANAIAASCPIPLVPPVIKAVCPSRENIENAEAVAILENDVYFQLMSHCTWTWDVLCTWELRFCHFTPMSGPRNGGNCPFETEARMGFCGVTWGRTSDVVKRYRQKPTLVAHSSCEAWIFWDGGWKTSFSQILKLYLNIQLEILRDGNWRRRSNLRRWGGGSRSHSFSSPWSKGLENSESLHEIHKAFPNTF